MGFSAYGLKLGEVTVWLEGTPVQTFPVDVDAEQSGFERRPDHWDVRMQISAGPHELTIAFPRQFHGLPTESYRPGREIDLECVVAQLSWWGGHAAA